MAMWFLVIRIGVSETPPFGGPFLALDRYARVDADFTGDAHDANDVVLDGLPASRNSRRCWLFRIAHNPFLREALTAILCPVSWCCAAFADFDSHNRLLRVESDRTTEAA